MPGYIRKEDIQDLDFLDAAELISDGYYIYYNHANVILTRSSDRTGLS